MGPAKYEEGGHEEGHEYGEYDDHAAARGRPPHGARQPGSPPDNVMEAFDAAAHAMMQPAAGRGAVDSSHGQHAAPARDHDAARPQSA